MHAIVSAPIILTPGMFLLLIGIGIYIFEIQSFTLVICQGDRCGAFCLLGMLAKLYFKSTITAQAEP